MGRIEKPRIKMENMAKLSSTIWSIWGLNWREKSKIGENLHKLENQGPKWNRWQLGMAWLIQSGLNWNKNQD
jgi:hypothetical protein